VPRLLPALVAIAVVSLATGCSDPSTATRPDPSSLIGPTFDRPLPPPTLDGIITRGEYDDAATVRFLLFMPTGVPTPVTVYITHDRTDLYMAVTFDRLSAFSPNDIIGFEFDNDNDGVTENGDDIVLSNPNTPFVVFPGADYYRFDDGAHNQSDAADGGTVDVSSVFGVSSTGTVGVFEFRHDLNSADDAHDFSIDPIPNPQTIGVRIGVSLEVSPGVYSHTFHPSQTTFCQLTIAKKTTSLSCP